MSNVELVRNEAERVLRKAEQMFGIDLSHTVIKFDLKGAAAGIASSSWMGKRLELRFNAVMINNGSFEHIFNDTVPHEVAHLVGFVTGRDNGHGRFWRNACIQLGGSGKTYHSEEVVYAKGKTYEYTATCGKAIRLSQQRHNKIQQRGAVLTVRSTNGKIHAGCDYRIVGISGQPVNTPAPQQIAAKKPAPNAAPKLKKTSKAEQVREAIRKCKANSEGQEVAVQFAVVTLGMKLTQAKRYVKENWDRA